MRTEASFKRWLLMATLGSWACSSPAPQRALQSPTLTQANVTGACALGVPQALVTVDETPDGVVFTFLAPPEQIGELRFRAQEAANLYGAGARRGLGHDGKHGQGGGEHGLMPSRLPPSRADVTNIDGGARVSLVPLDPANKPALVSAGRQTAGRMNAASCSPR